MQVSLTIPEWLAVSRLCTTYDATALEDWLEEEQPKVKAFLDADRDCDRHTFLDALTPEAMEFAAQELDQEVNDLFYGFSGSGDFRPSGSNSWQTGPDIREDDWWKYFDCDQPVGEWSDIRILGAELVGSLMLRERLWMVAQRLRHEALMESTRDCEA